MRINLKQLNKSYQQLQLLAGKELPKGQGKLAYKLGRIKETADDEVERLNKELAKMSKAHGFYIGGPNQPPRPVNKDEELTDEQIEAFNDDADKMMNETFIDLWGDPFRLEELEPHIALSGEMCAKLSWLIIDGERKEKAESAAAA